MNNYPEPMEKHFNPGFKTKPAVHIGSQTLKFFKNNPEEQAWEGASLGGASDKDVAVVRNFDPKYIDYWASLMDIKHVLNLQNTNPGEFLTEVILHDQNIIEDIKNKMDPSSKLMVFLPTELEQELADKLHISLHGAPKIAGLYGTKSGVRALAKEANLIMPPGFTCTKYSEIKDAIRNLSENFEYVVLKHDLSISGYYSKKLSTKTINKLDKILDNLVGGKFKDEKDVIVVEGWLNSKISLCAQIEILENQDPIICAGWQQIIDSDGISYIGGGPLMLSAKAMNSFKKEVSKIARILKNKGAIGSYAPDFLVAADDKIQIESDACVLIELNARVPYTAYALEIIKQVKSKIGNGFYVSHIKLNKKTSFREIADVLEGENLLIKKRDGQAKGVVPYNVGLLPWNLFDIVVMADSWEEASQIAQKTKNIFKNL